MRSLNALVWRNLTAHKLRSILTALAITLGVAMVLAASIVGQAAGQSAAELSEEGPHVDLEVFSRDGAPFDETILDTLRASPDVEQVSPSLRVKVELVLSAASLTVEGRVDPQIAGLTLLGVDPEAYQALHEPELAGGAFLNGPDTIVLPMVVAINNHLHAGDEITLLVPSIVEGKAGDRVVVLTVAGRLKLEQDMTALTGETVAYVPLSVAQTLAGVSEQVDQVEIALNPGTDMDSARIDLARAIGADLAVVRAQAAEGVGVTDVLIQVGLAMVGGIMLFAAAFVIMNAFAMSVTARIREIGALRALGMTRGCKQSGVMRQVLAEAGLLGLVGALLGIAVGIGLAWGVMTALGTLDDGVFAVPWWGIVVSVGMGLGVTLVGAFQPARRASRISPLAALRSQGAARESSWYARYGGRVGVLILAIMLPTLTAIALILRPSLSVALVLIGVGEIGLLVVTVLVLPALIKPTAELARPLLVRWLGVAGRLAADNLGRNKLRAVLTAGALTATLTTIIATSGLVSVMLKGGLTSFVSMWNEDGIVMTSPAELVASGEMTLDNIQSRLSEVPLDPGVLEALEPLVEAGVIEIERLGLAPVPPELLSYPGSPGAFVDAEIYLRIGNFDFFEGNAEDALAWMQRGRAVLIAPITAERLGVSVGDTVPLQTSQGEIEFTIAGIGGCGTAFPVFPYADGEAYFDMAGTMLLGLIVPEGKDIDVAIAQVRKAITPFEQVTVGKVEDDFLDGFLALVDQLQLLFNALLILAVVVAGLGVVNTMVINVAERRREIALLRAVGATQRQVRQAIVAEAATLGVMAAVIGTVVSVLMLGILILVMTPGGIPSMGLRVGWEVAANFLPIGLRDMFIAAALALVFSPLVAALAAYYPARQAAALDAVGATRSERVTLKTKVRRTWTQPEVARRHTLPTSLTWTMAWRNLEQGRTRTILSVLAVALGVAMIIAGDVIANAIFSAHQKSDTGQNVEFFAELFDFGLTVVGVAILVAAGFLVFNAFAMAITQRKRQIGALRSLGMTRGCKRSGVMRLVLVEALLTGGIGTLLGLVTGPLLGRALIALLRGAGELLGTTLAVFGEPSVSLSSFVVATALGVGITLFSVLIPARQATRISPLVALRQETASGVERTPIGRALVGLAGIAVLVIYLTVALPGEWTLPPWDAIMSGSFVLVWLACLGLTLPALVSAVAGLARKLLSRTWGATGRLVADNLRRNRRRVMLTILTLAVGLTMIVSMTGLISFLFDTLLGRMIKSTVRQDGWLIAPLDVTADMMESFGEMDLETMHVPPDLDDKVREVVGDRAAVGEWYMVVVPELSFLPGWNSYIGDAKELLDLGAYGFTFTEGDWETALPVMESGCGILMTPLVARNNDVWLGDTFTVQGKNGPVECTVVGLGSHPVSGNASFISLAAIDSFGVENPSTVVVAPFPGVDRERLDADLNVLLDDYPNVWSNRVAPLMESAGGAGDSLSSVMNGMLLLAVLAATLGIVNTTMMNVNERQRELGLLRAVGATRRQVSAIVTGEVALMGFIGGLLGLVAGAGVSVIFAVTYGGNAWGVPDLNLWDAAWEATQPALLVGLFGLIAAPLVSAVAAWLPVCSILRGSAIETMEPARRPEIARETRFFGKNLVSLNFLALRNLAQHRLRTVLSALAVALGVAMTVAADITSGATLNALSESADAQTFLTGLLDQLDMMLVLVGMGITFAAGFLVFNAFAMSVTQRRRQIGALRSLGMIRHQVMRLVLVEALITGGVGTLVGLIAGPLLGRGTIAMMKAFTEGIFVFGETEVSTSNLLLAAVMGLGVALLSALIPAWRATRISPLVALRAEVASGIAQSPVGRVVVGVLIVLAMAVYLIIAPPGEWVTSPMDTLLTVLFAVVWLGCLALILPALIGSVGRWTRAPLTRTWGATGRLMADNLGRGRGRVMLTILTLAVALTMIVGTTGFIRFMFFELMMPKIERAAQMGTWMLAPFDYTSGMSAYTDMASLALSPEAIKDVRHVVEGRGHVMPVHFVIVPELSFLGSTYFSFVADPQEWRQGGDPLFTFTEGDWETALPIMESGCGVLAAPVVAGRNDVSVGDTFEVTGADGPVQCTVAGIGSPFVGASVIGSAAGESFGTTEPIVAVVWPQPGVDRGALEADVTAMLDRYPGFVFNDLEDMTELQTRVMNAMPQMFNALLLLAIVAAALGVVNTTMMSVAERQRELGLLRAVGATRRQVNCIVTGEAALMGLIGGGVGLVAGAGIVVILAVVYGGNSWGVPDLDLWGAAWRSVQPALLNGLVGLVAAPFICAGAAWLPVRSLLRGSAIETIEPSRQQSVNLKSTNLQFLRRGSIRTRFVLGTAILMTIVLAGLIGVVTTHARVRIEEQMHDALRTMVTWNAGMIELGLPEDAETLDFDTLMAGGGAFDFDSDALLRFESLVDDMTANGLADFTIADRDNVVLIGLDMREIGTLVPELETTDEAAVYSECEEGEWLMHASAPVRNADGLLVGSVRLTVDARTIQDFLNKLRDTLGGIGVAIVFVGVGISWWLGTPLARATRQLAVRAAGVGRGEYALFDRPRRGRLAERLSLRTKLTAAMVLILVVMVGLLELVAIPIKRSHIEDTSKDALIAGVEWIGQAASEGFDIELAEFSTGQFITFEEMLDMTQTLDLARLQELTDQMRSDDMAYTALVDEEGTIILSDQLALIGEEVAVPSDTRIEETTWRDEEVWVASTPLRRGRDGEQIGALRMGVRRAGVESFLDESRTLFRLTGLIAVLAGVLLAQAIGGAVTAPVRQLAAGTRRVAAGDLTVQFRVDTADLSGRGDELALLANAYNQMVVGLREREWLRDMFGRFVSREVVEAIRTGQVKLEGENRVVSILFCDIRGFTARSEQSTPEEVVALLNEYLPVVVDAAQAHDGTVNKFGGDSALVIYGAPKPLQESAYRAVLTALEMRANLARLNERLVERGEAPLRVGVGINTGVVLAGAVGTEERQEYTVIGDTVNLASRIEALNKVYPDHDILISGWTCEALGSRRREFEFADLGEVQIRGKVEPVRVWAVVGRGR